MNDRAQRLQRIWYEGGAPGIGLRTLSWLYAAVTAARRWLYRVGIRRRVTMPVPVIVVGNLIAGGAGKTPLTIAIVQHLRAAGWRPGVVSRGYGRKVSGLVRVRADTPPLQAGDEPVLIARRTGASVAVAADRALAARALLGESCDVLIADDGLQHYRLARDIEIEVVDGARGYGNGLLLPAGPLREPVARGTRCDFRVINAGSQHAERLLAADEQAWPMQLRITQAVSLRERRARPLAEFAGRQVHAVAGIGYPQRFFAALRDFGIEPIEHAFPDHHAFSADDLRFSPALPVLMTEKDAVKCRAIAPAQTYAVPVDAELPVAFFDALLVRLNDARKPRA